MALFFECLFGIVLWGIGLFYLYNFFRYLYDQRGALKSALPRRRHVFAAAALLAGLLLCKAYFSYHEPPTAAVAAVETEVRQGNAEAQDILGHLYQNGHGGFPKDYAEAARWYGLSAGSNRKARYDLGFLYFQGLGVQRDYLEAYYWLSLAAEQAPAFPEGVERDRHAAHTVSLAPDEDPELQYAYGRDEAEKHLTPAQKAAADKRIALPFSPEKAAADLRRDNRNAVRRFWGGLVLAVLWCAILLAIFHAVAATPPPANNDPLRDRQA